MRFIATARFSCASLLMLPKLIAPVAKRRTIFTAGSTSSTGTGSAADARSQQPRSVKGESPWSLMAWA